MTQEVEKDTEVTKVVFRKWRTKPHTVIAIFPEELGDNSPYTCSSYEHIGQHGSCDPFYLTQATRLAKPAEYAALKEELENHYGYKLRVMKRIQYASTDVRRAKLAAISGSGTQNDQS